MKKIVSMILGIVMILSLALSASADGIKVNVDLDSMSVEELMSYISVEEAKKMVVPFGRYKGSLMGEVCVNDPKSIRWIVDSYKGNRNIIRAAAKVLLNAVE